MKRITAENFEELYVDKIELAEIDKFVCCEMSRQIHRYIKGMSGSKTIMVNDGIVRHPADDFCVNFSLYV